MIMPRSPDGFSWVQFVYTYRANHHRKNFLSDRLYRICAHLTQELGPL